MTDEDHDLIGLGDVADTDAVLERLLAGDSPGPHAPAWCGDVALLVRAAQAPATDDELAREDDIVQRMLAVRLAADDADVPAPSDAPARHAHDRTYRAKHAAARLEASRHPAVRTLGRVIAVKAAAVTTAAVIGVAAAAAATTGIVATVVVPALSSNEHREPSPPPATIERPQRSGTDGGLGGRGPASPDRLPLVTCPLLPACAAAERSAPTSPTTEPTATSAPIGMSPAEEVVPTETTTTTAPSPTTTIAPTATTVPETPTTTTSTTVPEDPGPVTPMSGPDGGATGATATEAPSPTSSPSPRPETFLDGL